MLRKDQGSKLPQEAFPRALLSQPVRPALAVQGAVGNVPLLAEMLKGEWLKNLRTGAKYNDKWADAFAEGLMRSEYGNQIADDWKEKANQVKGYVIGCLKEAGVFKENVSNDNLARDAGIMSNTRTFGKYIGKESQEQPYAKWILKHVNDYC